MSRPWMPLYVADYLKKTAHLGALESGAYLHLIMHYWSAGKLPSDDKQLSRIARMTPDEWAASKSVIQDFFHHGWKHERVDDELVKSAALSNKRRASAEQMHATKDAIAEQLHTQPHSPSHSKIEINGNGVKAKGWSPPRHGATGRGMVYIEFTHDEWKAYSDDFRSVHKRDPVPNKYGGKWFKMAGEATS